MAQVRFDPPKQPVADSDLHRLVAFPPGTPLTLDEIRAAIKRLYGTGRYSTVEADTETSPAGLTLIFRTTDQWFVGPVEVKGKANNPPNLGQLANASRLDLGAPFNEGDLQTAVAGLTSLLQRNGLYMATVNPTVVRDAEHQQVSVTFQVNSGKRARLTLPQITGDTRLPPADLARAAKFKEILFFPWKQATQENVGLGLENIRRFYTKKDRLTADVTLDRTDYLASENRVRPTINADGGPVVKIQATGAKVSKGTLQKYVPVFDEGTANRDLLVAGDRNLRDYFQNNGYFDVQVDFESHDTGRDLQTITYTVSLGEKHRVVSLAVKGNHYFTTQQIRERMYLQPKGWIRLRHGRYSQSFADRDEDAIEGLYRDSGFRDCKATANVIDDYQGKKGDVAITMNVVEGSQYLVSGLQVNGMKLPNKDAILAKLASQPGQPFSETSVAMDRDYILESYRSVGYPSAAFDYRATPAAEPYRMSLVYTVTEGQPQYVRDVLITGLHVTRKRLTNPVVTLHAGDPLSWTEMGRMQRRLYNLGAFDKVDMAIQNPDGNTEEKYVDFHVVEGHLYTVAVGVGAEIAKIGASAAGTANPTGKTGFAPRFDFQISRLNLWGLGHTVSFKSRYSTLDRRVSLTYLAPRFRNVEGRNITVDALYDNTRDVLTFTAVRLQGGVQVSQRLSKATNLLYRYQWTNDRVDKTSLRIDPELIPLYSQPSRVAMFAVNLVQDRRDDPADAHHGIYNSLDLGLAENKFGGTTNFLRFLGRNSYYKTLGQTQMVLASNTEFGIIGPFHTGGTATTQYIPLPERFFGGGEANLRAFPNNQAGPRDTDTGFPLGGNALLFHSTELRFPFIGDNIQGVLFHDMGNVYTSLGSISFRVHQNGLTDFDYMVHAAGFGVRYRTPLGPLRVDLAYSINPPTFNGLQGTYQQLLFGGATRTVQSVSHFQFFFSIGQAF
ncbi:MAG TPA: POTRA domain-containing protein [Candidatus Sulfopaludibacter sp.]|nr:POTRA domain-containing protein [Candidatus Sulfopaludibacter sp.]